MARIPTPAQRGQAVGSVQSQFTPTPFQNLNPDADVFGAGQARTMKQVSAGLDALSTGITKQAEEDDTLTLLTTQEQSGAFEIEVVNETLNQKQGNAIGASERAMGRFAAYEASIKPASTQAGRLAQQRHLLQLKSSIASRSASHERDEVFKFKAGKVAGAIGTAQNRAGLNWNNPDIINQSIEVVTAQTGNLADMNGATDPEARSLVIKAGVSKTYMSALRGAIGADNAAGYAEAKKILSLAIEKDGLTAEDKEAALKLVQDGTVRGESQQIADRIMANDTYNPEQRLAEARAVKDPATRTATVALVKERNSEVVATENRIKKERYEAASKIASEGRTPSEVLLTGLDYYQRKNVLAAALDARKRKADPDYDRQPINEVAVVFSYNKKKSADVNYLVDVDLDAFKAEYELEVSKPQFDVMLQEVYAAKAAVNKVTASDTKKLSARQQNMKMSTTAVAKLKQTFKALNSGVDPNKGAGIKAFLAWQLEFDKRVIQENAITESARADIINRMTLSKVITDKSDLYLGTDDVGYAFALDADQIKLMARKEFDFSDDEEAAFIDAFPVMVNSLRVQRVPATNDSIGSTFKTLFSATNQLPRDQRVNFLAGYPALTKKIREAGGALTERNYLLAWEQVGGRVSNSGF